MNLKVCDASFAYPSGEVLFQHVNYDIESGSALAVLGRNGVGKTTLLKCIMGVLPWRTGHLEMDGHRIADARSIREIAFVPQAHSVSFGYSLEEFVTMGRARYMGSLSIPSKKDREIALNALDEVGLVDLRDRQCNQLSGGQLQLVYLARALAAEPQLLILDEPESHLDFNNQFFILELLEKLVRETGIAVILNTHYPENALHLADRILLLRRDGYLFGKTKDVLTEENIRLYFGVEAILGSIERRGKAIPVFAVTGRV